MDTASYLKIAYSESVAYRKVPVGSSVQNVTWNSTCPDLSGILSEWNSLLIISQALASEVDLEESLLSVLLDVESLLLLSPLLLSPSLLDDASLSFFALSLYPSLR